MHAYVKEIHLTHSSVQAIIYRDKKDVLNEVSREYFYSSFWTEIINGKKADRRFMFKKAHKWADEVIQQLKELEE